MVHDAQPRTLYVHRKVTNAREIIAWARGQGLSDTLDAPDLHVTVAFSRKPLDWFKVSTWGSGEEIEIKGGPRLVQPLGDKGAVVLLIANETLKHRHDEFLRAGASWDWPEYQPHVTLTYRSEGVDLGAVEPYQGDIILGPEVFSEVDDDWADSYRDGAFIPDSACRPAAHPVHTMSDAATIGGARTTRDGYLVADAKIARTGIQLYAGAEVGRPAMPVVRVYRPEAEVFSKDAMQSMAYRPVTMDHPSEMVSADNWRKHSVGSTGAEIARDGDFIRVPLTLMDAQAIRDVQSGKRQLSVGYLCDLSFEAGTAPDGQAYDAVQRNIRANHLAVVAAGRAGPDCRIGDGRAPVGDSNAPDSKGGHPMADMKKVVVDGLTVETTDQGAEVIQKLQGQLKDAADAHAKALADAEAQIKAKDAELGKKDGEIEDLKAKQMDAAALDALVKDRSEVIAKAKAIAKDVKTEGAELGDIRRAAVAAKLGDDRVKDKADAYVEALFDHLAADAKAADPVRAASMGGNPAPAKTTDADTAYAASVDRLTNAWKGDQKEAH